MSDNLKGKIIKGIAGFYYVYAAGSGIYECRAKGIFRKEGIKPCVGDEVEIEITDAADMEANVVKILPRRNLLYRPAAANVDQALLLFALEAPRPNAGVLDRFLIQMEKQSLPAVICFNKRDLVTEETAEHWCGIYKKAGYEVICISVKEGTNLDEVRRLTDGKTTVLAGPSGSGKSSLINALSEENRMETGEISRKLKRGRHTTRHAELITIREGTYIFDTPGFTSFVTEEMSKEELQNCFPEFAGYEKDCRFAGCAHVDEPDCALKAAVKEGKIAPERYDSYVRLYKELKEAEKNKYN